MADRKTRTAIEQRPKFQDDPAFMETLELIIHLRKSKEAVDRLALSMGGEIESINQIATRIDKAERLYGYFLGELMRYLEVRSKEKQGTVPEANTKHSRTRARSAA